MFEKLSKEAFISIMSASGLMMLAWRMSQGLPVHTKQAIGYIILAVLGSGCSCLVLFHRFQDNLPLLAGVSIVLGVGWSTILEIVFGILKKYKDKLIGFAKIAEEIGRYK